MGRLHPPAPGALPRRQSHHGRGRDLDVRDAQGEGPAVLPELLRPGHEGREGRRAQGPLHVRPRGQPGAAPDRGPAPRPVPRLLEPARLREDHARAAARQRGLPGRRGRSRAVHHLPPREGLLGRQATGERRPRELRLDPHRLLPGLHGRRRGAQGARVRLPAGERGEDLGDRLQHAGRDPGARPEGGDPERGPDRHAGVHLQHAAADLPGRAGPPRARPRLRLRVEQQEPLLQRVHADEELLLELGAGLQRPAHAPRS